MGPKSYIRPRSAVSAATSSRGDSFRPPEAELISNPLVDPARRQDTPARWNEIDLGDPCGGAEGQLHFLKVGERRGVSEDPRSRRLVEPREHHQVRSSEPLESLATGGDHKAGEDDKPRLAAGVKVRDYGDKPATDQGISVPTDRPGRQPRGSCELRERSSGAVEERVEDTPVHRRGGGLPSCGARRGFRPNHGQRWSAENPGQTGGRGVVRPPCIDVHHDAAGSSPPDVHDVLDCQQFFELRFAVETFKRDHLPEPLEDASRRHDEESVEQVLALHPPDTLLQGVRRQTDSAPQRRMRGERLSGESKEDLEIPEVHRPQAEYKESYYSSPTDAGVNSVRLRAGIMSVGAATRRIPIPTEHRSRKGYRGVAMEGFIARWYTKIRSGEEQVARCAADAQALTKGLANGAAILEVAPGPGILSVELARLGRYQVTGLDISRTFVAIATERARRAGVRAAFREGNASDLPFPDSSFDLVVTQAAFKNFSEPQRAIDEMFRVLLPGGGAIIQDMRKEATEEAIVEEVASMHLGRLQSFLTRRALRGLRRRAYTRGEFEELARRSRFGAHEISTGGIGLELRLRR
jgi:ubiquinone/menaquinone biosynthesis C-methylase UbiE